MKVFKFSIILCPLAILICSVGNAGSLSDKLGRKIAALDPNEKVEVIISMKETSLLPSLMKELDAGLFNLSERHRYGISKLKAGSEVSQRELLTYLKNMESAGLASKVKSHWLINVISAEIAAGELEKVAMRDDIVSIFESPEIELIEPELGDAILAKPNVGVESNITAIGADDAWRAGYTGKGRIICSFDTGIEGNHPAIYSNWKGHDGDSAAAWFDPITGHKFPHPIGNSSSSTYKHGTHTMGIMVGHDDLTGDTVGVAPDAKWISAAVIDVGGASIIDAFEWAADPDGDPNTISDLPDVINHSWGISNDFLDCNAYFWNMIDNIEALGVVNIFAAGNDGSASATIANPANRAKDSLNCFAVGNIEGGSRTIYWNSSRGPSDCDFISIKPNVVAPGVNIRSSVPPAIYGFITGTSMAAPHVAGAVAILRQYAPNATVHEIKEALLASATRLPDGEAAPNNTYGWGLINIPAAMAALVPKSAPRLRVFSYNHNSVNPGDTASGYVVIKNLGDTVFNLIGIISGYSGGLMPLNYSMSFGSFGLGDTAWSDVEFRAAVADTVAPGSLLSADFSLIYNSSDTQTAKIYIMVGDKPQKQYFTHSNNLIKFTVSNHGQYGFAAGSNIPLGYSGFQYKDTNYLFEGSFMIAFDSLHVSDGARNVIEEPDNDFAVAPGGELQYFAPGHYADQQTISVFNDSKAENPMNLQIVQKTYSWNDLVRGNFVILEFIIKNLSANSYSGLYPGLFLDWDIIGYTQNCGGFLSDEKLGYMAYCSDVPSRFRGVSAVIPEEFASYKLRRNPIHGGEEAYYFNESEKYQSLSSGIIDTAGAGTNDLGQIISAGPINLVPGESATVVFAILADDDLAGLRESALKARKEYFCAAINKTPSITAPGDTALFSWCAGEICIGGFNIVDENNNLATITVTGAVLTDSGICFTPGDGVNIIRIIATDSCGSADTAVINVTAKFAYSRDEVDTIAVGPETLSVNYGGGNAAGKIFWRFGGQWAYDSAVMITDGVDTLSYIAPSSSITARGLEYYFRIIKNSETIYIGGPESPFKLVVRLSNSAAQRPEPTSSGVYRIVGVPIEISGSKTVASVFGDDLGPTDKKQWRLGSYNSSTKGYDEYPSAAAVNPGQGYWLITKEPKIYGAAGYSVTPNAVYNGGRYYEISLDSGWNQLANPFAFDIEWSDILFGDADSIFSGHPAAILDDAAYWYSGSGYATVPEIPAWDGFFAYIKRNNIKAFFPYKESLLAPTDKNTDEFSSFAGAEWQVELQLESNGLHDDFNIAGVKEEAKNEFDIYDFAEPPAPPEGAYLAFASSSPNAPLLGADFRAPKANGYKWNLLIHIQNESKLRLIERGHFPDDFGVWLVFDNGSTVPAIFGKDIILPADINSAELIIGNKAFLSDQRIAALPEDFTLEQNYPNPFNPVTVIKFSLPIQADIRLEIFNILGQKTKTLIRSKYPAGHHAVEWDGQDESGNPVASGIYFYKLTSGDKILTRKMVLLK
jgi:subtilisin family serine protease